MKNVTLPLFCVLPILVAGLVPRAASAQAVELRPIDRATVRIISVRGAQSAVLEGRRSRRPRVLADFVTNHGSGLAIERRTVVTAAHVLAQAEHWAVIPPGHTEAIPAYPRYVDPVHDVAFLEVAAPLPHAVSLGRPRPLSLSERVSVSGYPLDVRESSPAAVTGELSRIARDGLMHLAMAVNPGHSGGPVIDGRGRPIGIVSARGRLDRGVEGLTLAVPLSVILEARGRVPDADHAFTASEREVAAALPLLLRLDRDEPPATDDVLRLVRETVSRGSGDVEADAIVAVTGWNTLLARMEHPDPPPALESLRTAVMQLAGRALTAGPHLRRHYPVLRVIAAGRVDPFPAGPPTAAAQATPSARGGGFAAR